MREPHEVRVFLILDRRTNLIIDAQPMIRFVLRKPVPFPEGKKRLSDVPILGRLFRVMSFRAEVDDSVGIQSLEITFRDLRNKNLEWGCNGFIIDADLIQKTGTSRTVTYFVGSGLDPFTSRDGRKRDQAFESKDVLLDSEYGLECELDEFGARVFLKQ